MKKIVSFVVFSIMAVFTLLNAGLLRMGGPHTPLIDNQVVPLQLGTSIRVIENALDSEVGAQILQRKDLFAFITPMGNGFGMTGIDAASKTPIQDFAQFVKNGQIMNARTMKDLVDTLTNNGWKVISAAEVPAFVKTNLFAAKMSIAAGAFVNSSMITFVVVPAGTFWDSTEILKHAKELQ